MVKPISSSPTSSLSHSGAPLEALGAAAQSAPAVGTGSGGTLTGSAEEEDAPVAAQLENPPTNDR